MRLLLWVSALSLSLGACVSNKYIYRGNTLYKVTVTEETDENSTQADPRIRRALDTIPAPLPPPPPQVQNLTIYRLESGFKANLTEKTEGLIISPVDKINHPDGATTSPFKLPIQGFRAESQGKIYFPEIELDTLPNGNGAHTKLRYFDTKPVLQALTIPLRIRPKLTDAGRADSFPQQVETGVNVGLAFGWKFTHNVYKANKGLFGQNTNRYSLSPGLFFGLGATDLKQSNTRGPKIPFERKAALVTSGIYLMAGFNSVNVGFATGKDRVIGSEDEKNGWLYQKKRWYGVIFAIDLLK